MRNFFLIHLSLFFFAGFTGYNLYDLFIRYTNNDLFNSALSFSLAILPVLLSVFCFILSIYLYKKLYWVKKETLKEFVIAEIKRVPTLFSVRYVLISTTEERLFMEFYGADLFKHLELKPSKVLYVGGSIVSEESLIGSKEPLTTLNFLKNTPKLVQCYNR